ncbi:MAG: GMP synthase [Bacteroidota bacterium]
MQEKKPRLAILDMNNQHPNQGMRSIRNIVERYTDQLEWDEFDVRAKHEVPDTSYDIYISSGGPGSPKEEGEWKDRFLQLVDDVWQHNAEGKLPKKHFFFICHSFQMVCAHFDLGELMPRKSTAFGVYPVHKTKAGLSEPLFEGLDDPYYVVDSRDWQLVQPRLEVFEEHGAHILSLEKLRTHVEYERAIMAVRFSDEFIGTQYHPEADPYGMRVHFKNPENREKVVRNHGERKYEKMMSHLDYPRELALTHQTILPRFIETSLRKLSPEPLGIS